GQGYASPLGGVLEQMPKIIFETDVGLAASDRQRAPDHARFRLVIAAPCPKHSIKCRKLAVQIVELPSWFRRIADAILLRGCHQVIQDDLPVIASLEQDETLLEKLSPIFCP